ncbi:MAG: DUF3307 domain-containing protein [Chlorobi bacterium]|nr:DUF3307 domain-containing protein [Chlorobiota bacterium]
MVEAFLLLLLAHVLTDFFFNSRIGGRGIKGELFHGLVHGMVYILVLLLITSRIDILLLFGLGLGVIHALIDMFHRYYLKPRGLRYSSFMVDQWLHLFSIYLISYLLGQYTAITPAIEINNKLVLRFILIMAAIFPSSVLIRLLIEDFFKRKRDCQEEGPREFTGAVIGNYERLFIVFLMYMEFFLLVGLMMIAKGLFLLKHECVDREVLTYGTIVSYFIGVAGGMGVLHADEILITVHNAFEQFGVAMLSFTMVLVFLLLVHLYENR